MSQFFFFFGKLLSFFKKNLFHERKRPPPRICLPSPRLSNTRKKIPWDLHPLDLSPSPPACAVIHRPFFVFPSPSINSPQRYHMHEPWQPTPSTSSSATPAPTRCCCRGRRRRRSQPGTRTTVRSAGFAHINFFKTKIILFFGKTCLPLLSDFNETNAILNLRKLVKQLFYSFFNIFNKIILKNTFA